MEFYQTQMGRAFFERQLPQLIDAVNALAAALSKPVPAAVLPVSADPKFLRDAGSLRRGHHEGGYTLGSEGLNTLIFFPQEQ